MSVRKKQMAERKARIVTAAEKLTRETGGTDFTMRALAAEAGVSPATPFNLFGSKESILYDLLLQSLDTFFNYGLNLKSTTPIDRALEAADIAVDLFVLDQEFLRPLYRFLLGVNDPKARPVFLQRSLTFWQLALETTPPEHAATNNPEITAIAHGLLAHILGLLDVWVHQDISDEQFRLLMRRGVLLQVWPIAKSKDLPALKQRFKETLSASVRPAVAE
ncbi:TetR/AcrR family transcriptional regulator [Spongiibacter taiwanensis]|uniref:TetR/AcrR family transcriptional regulator n=1 Tax=Spongiibacter taiwanensis TaxID=1748242 RepID=UPI0020360DDC|nr:TetR/AcrR family transcriptional regulator [Spongiibacter taiwanensis]USA42254.1 TetR/AcrR family transcriptional regulator [Spongiibacter taiwanensis]